jgi:uncharacterized protein YndB with AHSA1/START domain
MSNEKGKDFIITREFDAPHDLVWEVYTKKEHLEKWWGPKGFRMHVAKLDFRPNGIFHYCMEAPDGNKMWGKFVYREITPKDSLVFVVSFSDAQGNITRHPFSPTWPLEILNTVLFTEKNGKTTLTMNGGPINATAEERKVFEDNFAGMNEGFKGTLDQLEEYLSNQLNSKTTVTE